MTSLFWGFQEKEKKFNVLTCPAVLQKVAPDLPISCKHSLAWQVLYPGLSFYTSHDFGWPFLHGNNKQSATFMQRW